MRGGPDGLIANGAHFLEFFELGRVVDGAERTVATTVDVNAVGDLVVFFPDPVFFEDGGSGAETVGVGGAASEEFSDDEFGKMFLAHTVEEDAVAGELLLYPEPVVEGTIAV